MDHILTYMTFIPIAGALIVLCLPSDKPDWIRWTAAGTTVPPLLMAIWLFVYFDRTQGRLPVRRARAVDPELQHRVLRRRRRHQHHDGAAHGAAQLPVHVRLVRHREGGEGLLRALPAARRGDDGRVRQPRLLPLLHLLGADAAADVLPHRHLGRPAARVRGHQVLPLHPGRQRADAAGVAGAVLHANAAHLRHDQADGGARDLLDHEVLGMRMDICCGSRCSSASPSRSRRSRSTPGCRTRTSRRRRRSR